MRREEWGAAHARHGLLGGAAYCAQVWQRVVRLATATGDAAWIGRPSSADNKVLGLRSAVLFLPGVAFDQR